MKKYSLLIREAKASLVKGDVARVNHILDMLKKELDKIDEAYNTFELFKEEI